MPKVLVAVPTFDGAVKAKTFESAANLDWGDNDVEYKTVAGYDCAAARNNIVDEMLKRKFDYCLMVDSDVVVPQDALTNLMEHGEPLVLGWYAHQGSFAPPHGDGKTCLCKPQSYHDQFTGDELKELRDDGKYKVQIRGGGMGCALVRRDAVERTCFPWFKFVVYDDRHGVLSEDLYFCKKLRDVGITPYGDARVECGHYFRHVEWL